MSSNVESSKRVVVEGRWDGNVIPGRIEEVAREVFIRPGSYVHGGVFGDRIEMEGAATIEKCVYASRDVRLIMSDDLVCQSSLGAKRNISSEDAAGVLRVYGDVIGHDISLRRAAILGSLHGRNVRLSECVVLGPVVAERRADLSHCCVLTANAAEIRLGSGVTTVLPYLMASERIDLESAVQCTLIGDESGSMNPEDLVTHDEGVTLSLGRRMTDLTQVEHRIRGVLHYMQDQVVNGVTPRTERHEEEIEGLPPIMNLLVGVGRG
jgi:hypothetical protein